MIKRQMELMAQLIFEIRIPPEYFPNRKVIIKGHIFKFLLPRRSPCKNAGKE